MFVRATRSSLIKPNPFLAKVTAGPQQSNRSINYSPERTAYVAEKVSDVQVEINELALSILGWEVQDFRARVTST